nr:FecR domain-containing protein [uncultured Duganella sp.]
MPTIDDQAASWMVRCTGRGLNAREQQQFDTWLAADIRHQGAYLRAMAIHNALSHATVQENLRPRPENALTLSPAPQPPSARNGLQRLPRHGALAAGLALVCGLLWHTIGNHDLVTAKGETRQFPLADTSLASLNSGSKIAVELTDSARRINLKQGEAWFQVAKDKRKPFIVSAGAVRVKAVGTAFAVRRYPQGADILVTEGVVEVWSNKGGPRRLLLSQGERAFVPELASEMHASRQPGEIARRLAWRTGKLIFINQTLAEAVADFNRYSPRKLIIADPSLYGITFIGQYAVDAPEVFAKDVCTYLNVPLQITADTILIGATRPGFRGNKSS